MLILTLNCGSSSVKLAIVDVKKRKVLWQKSSDRLRPDDHKAYLFSLSKLVNEALAFTESDLQRSIVACVHRVVHGGSKLSQPVRLDRRVYKEISAASKFAPLHNPFALLGIDFWHSISDCPAYAVFDTGYYQSLDELNRLYALPIAISKKHGIRRFGFHGINHEYLNQVAKKKLAKSKLKVISCHLGNGASVTASVDGKAVATSMGFTPLEGLVMGTRSGDLDPGILLFLLKEGKYSLSDLEKMLQKESGILGLSGGLSSDMRDYLHPTAKKFADKAPLIIDYYCYKLAQKIASLLPSLGAVPDVIVFSGGVGQNSHLIRSKTLEYLNFLDINIDKKANLANTELFSKASSKIQLMAIPANEELAMALKVANFLK